MNTLSAIIICTSFNAVMQLLSQTLAHLFTVPCHTLHSVYPNMSVIEHLICILPQAGFIIYCQSQCCRLSIIQSILHKMLLNVITVFDIQLLLSDTSSAKVCDLYLKDILSKVIHSLMFLTKSRLERIMQEFRSTMFTI